MKAMRKSKTRWEKFEVDQEDYLRTIFEWIKDLDTINEPKEPDVLNSRFNGSASARQNTIT